MKIMVGGLCSFWEVIMEGLPQETALEQRPKEAGGQPGKYPEKELSRQSGGKCKGPGAGAAMECRGHSRRGQCGWSSRDRRGLRVASER